MIVTAWKSGRHNGRPGGYGLRIRRKDLNSFDQNWGFVSVTLPDGNIFRANIDKDSMWAGGCRELISKDLGKWLLESGLAPWPKAKPPKFSLASLGQNRFKLMR
jgi:hypothetical protein